MSSNIEFVSAGAGSGKTYSLTERLEHFILNKGIKSEGIIATTFTRLAATELKERVRKKLITSGHLTLANSMERASINTVNSVCGQLLQRFSFEAGLSPELRVLDEKEAEQMFSACLDQVLGQSHKHIMYMNDLASRLGQEDDKKNPLWKQHVLDVVSSSRSNDFDTSELIGFSTESQVSLLAEFRDPIQRDLDADLIQQIEAIVSSIDTETDKTKKTKEYISFIRSVLFKLKRGEKLSWSTWVKLSKDEPGAKSKESCESIRIIASDYEAHPLLREDVSAYIKGVFELAASSLDNYQNLKKQKGCIDFTDQEHLLFHLLDDDSVASILSEELELLMVDEFQDTSPIQLALFTKLAKFADHVIWVGDIKQAIYGFRGSDPELMLSALEGIESRGGKADVLSSSWRSRPELVDFCNQVFVTAFKDTLTESQISLSAERPEKSGESSVMTWCVSGNQSQQLSSVANGINDLIDNEYQVVDKDTEEPRSIRPGDIAVLCRTNSRLKTLAKACSVAGIEVSYSRPGLLSTPECTLALACLRYMADPRDTLAAAEIQTLALGKHPEEWLPERLSYLASENADVAWGEEVDASPLRKLSEKRKVLNWTSPTEALLEAIVVGDIHRVINRWGPTIQKSKFRLANIEALIALGKDYEQHCQTQGQAANVAGLLLWLSELSQNEEDWQATSKNDDVVSLVTYHGAKGLEWPVVIACDQEFTLRSRLWGLSVQKNENAFDFDEPLSGRKLRFWPYPFGKQSKGIPLRDRIENSEQGEQCLQAAYEEEKRLQYVTFTRARDLLVFPVKDPSKTTVPGILGSEWIYPESDELLLPNGTTIKTQCKDFEEAGSADTSTDYSPHWLAGNVTNSILIDRTFNASSAVPLQEAEIGVIKELGNRLSIESQKVDMAALGSALHNVIAADINLHGDLLPSRIAEILKAWGVHESFSSSSAKEASERLQRELQNLYPQKECYVEYPISYENSLGQEMKGFVDLLIDTPEGWVIVDHKSSPGKRSGWASTALKYSGQLALYKESIETLTKRPVIDCWIHFAVTGGLVQVSV